MSYIFLYQSTAPSSPEAAMIRPDALWKGFRSLFYSLRFLSFLYTSSAIVIILINLILSDAREHELFFYVILSVDILLILINLSLAYLLARRWKDVVEDATADRGE